MFINVGRLMENVYRHNIFWSHHKKEIKHIFTIDLRSVISVLFCDTWKSLGPDRHKSGRHLIHTRSGTDVKSTVIKYVFHSFAKEKPVG